MTVSWLLDRDVTVSSDVYKYAQSCLGAGGSGATYGVQGLADCIALFNVTNGHLLTVELPRSRTVGQRLVLNGVDRGCLPVQVLNQHTCVRLLPLNDTDLGVVLLDVNNDCIDVLEVPDWRSNWTSSRVAAGNLQFSWSYTQFTSTLRQSCIASLGPRIYAAVQADPDGAGACITLWDNGFRRTSKEYFGLQHGTGICAAPDGRGYLVSCLDQAHHAAYSQQPGYKARSAIFYVAAASGTQPTLSDWAPYKAAAAQGLVLHKGQSNMLLPVPGRGLCVGSALYYGCWSFINSSTGQGSSSWQALGQADGCVLLTSAGLLQWQLPDPPGVTSDNPSDVGTWSFWLPTKSTEFIRAPDAAQVSKWRSNIQGACFGKPADLSKLLSRLRAVGPPVGSTPSAAPPLIMVQPQLQGQSEAFAAAAAMDANLSVQGIGQLLLGCAAGKVSVAATATSLQRPFGMTASGSWMDAAEAFDSLRADKGKPDVLRPGVEGIAAAGYVVCAYNMRLLRPGAAGGSSARLQDPSLYDRAFANENTHPLQHLAAAVLAGGRPSSDGGAQPGSTQQHRLRACWAVAYALVFLLHPDTQSATSKATGTAAGPAAEANMLAALVPTAMEVLSRNAAIAFGTSAEAARGQRGAAAEDPMKPMWKKLAASSKSLTSLLGLAGLESVKEEMFNIAGKCALDQERMKQLKLGETSEPMNYNACFYGNPGTGKTTVARLYAGLLEELKVLPASTFEETSGASLLSGGLSDLKAKLAKLDKGGVLFIDEAYQLEPSKNQAGKQILDYLLPEMTNKRGTLVVVLAGYEKPMQEQVMAYNEGMPSRFPVIFKFPDYSNEQLLKVFATELQKRKPGFRVVDDKYTRIAIGRLGKRRDLLARENAPGFGNARDVGNLLEAAIRAQAGRLLREREAGGKPDLMLIQRDDLLGPKELDISASSAWKQLQSMVGLNTIKTAVQQLLALTKTNAELEELEKPTRDICLNRVFLGNPGTGKTTVAGIYGRILKDLGLLSKGDVLVKKPDDFMGSVLGESEKKTIALLEQSRGCVLVIDEAYGLHPGKGTTDPYKNAVIDTLVAAVQGLPGDDRCVLMLGYKAEMQRLFDDCNPGLARRFQWSQPWVFDDYTKEELRQIVQTAAKKKGWQLGMPELRAALSTLEKQKRLPNFGNANAVSQLLSTVAQKMETRLKDLPVQQRVNAQPAPEDFEDAPSSVDPAQALEGLVGMEEALAFIKEAQAAFTAAVKMGEPDPTSMLSLNLRFTGPPGTGKTTVARRMGQVFYNLGVLASPDVVEVSAKDLQTGYVGQAPGKTREVFKNALGKVLFIDEAYRLNPANGGSFMSEVLDEMVQLLTSPEFKGKMVVILAGYKQEVEELMDVNPGLRSRFTHTLEFKPMDKDAAVQLLKQMLTAKSLKLSSDAEAQLPAMTKQLAAAPSWASGRDVDTWVKKIWTAWSVRVVSAQPPLDQYPVEARDLNTSLQQMLAEKRSAAVAAAAASSSKPPGQQAAYQGQYAPPPPKFSAEVAAAAAATGDEGAAPAAQGATIDNTFWLQMQAALEGQGYQFGDLEAVKQLAADPGLADKLVSLMPDVAVDQVQQGVKQWQEDAKKELKKEEEAKAKKLRPVWRCAVCGRYNCSFRPYIERYEEI